MRPFLLILVAVSIAIAAPLANAEWYDDYKAGIDAVKAKNWDLAVEKMNAALAQKSGEEGRARTYGTTFINYRPYYYRGVAYLNKGEWAKAIEDLKRTGGAGEVNLGDHNSLLITANQQLTAEQIRSATPAQPPPQQQQTPAEPPRPDPQIQQARTRAENAIQQARSKFGRAQAEDASVHAASDFDNGSNLLRQATSASVDATTAADFQRVADIAERAGRAFDASISNAQMRVAELDRQRQRDAQAQQSRPTPPSSTPAVTSTPPPTQSQATDDVLAQTKERLRVALEAYFDGDFRSSANRLEQITLDQPNNAMIFAFLGASHYYEYYLGGQRNAEGLSRAKDAFRQAKSLNPSLDLDPTYFSTRLRSFYEEIN